MHDTKTEQATHDDLHPLAESGPPEHGDWVKGIEVVQKNVGDHAEIAYTSADGRTGVVGSTSGGAHVGGEDGCDAGPDDNDANRGDEDGLISHGGRETVQDEGNRDLDDARRDVQDQLVGPVELLDRYHG